MKFTLVLIAGFSFLIASCSNKSADTYVAKVIRGSTNQASIKIINSNLDNKVQGAQRPQGNSVEADIRLFEEQGFQCAYDRFLQMDVFRRSSQGRLSEVFGKKAYTLDVAMLGRGLILGAENSIIKLKKNRPEIYTFLEAYSRGVNRFINAIKDIRPEWLKFYRQVTKDENYIPALWTPEDSASIGAFFSFYLSNSLNEKFSLGALYYLLLMLGQTEDFTSLIDLRPLKNTFIFDKPVKGFEVSEIVDKVSKKAFGSFAPFVTSSACQENSMAGLPLCSKPAGTGSNNWAVSSRFTKNGETYIANDPHLILTQQGIMKQVALDSKSAGGTIRTRGFTPPGSIGVLIGHNDDIAWGMTNFPADVDDIYIEVLSNDESEARTADGKWLPLVSKNYLRNIRMENGRVKEVVLPLKIVPGHGPLISNYQKEIKVATLFLETEKDAFTLGKDSKNRNEKMGASYRWTGHEGGGELASIIAMNRSKNFSDFKKGLETFEVGAQNFIYGDKQGNIGYYSHARFPIRKYLTETRPPYVPVQAFQKEDFGGDKPEVYKEWSGYRTEFPELYNPEKGYIVTANNDPFGISKSKTHSNYSNYLGYGFDFGYRAYRIEELLNEIRQQKGSVAFSDMKVIQNDVKDYAALEFVEFIRKLKLSESLMGDRLEVVNKLLAWNGVSDRHRNEPTLYYYWMMELLKERFDYKKVENLKTRSNLILAEAIDNLLAKKDEPKKPNQKDNIHKAWNDAVNNIFMTTILVKSAFNYIKDELAKNDPKANEKLSLMFRVSLTRALAVLDKYSMRNASWGQLNRLVFLNPLQGLMPAQFNMSVERPGSFSTVSPSLPGFYLGSLLTRKVVSKDPNAPVDPFEENVKSELERLQLSEDEEEGNPSNARPGFGAAFRIVYKLKEGQPIEGQVSYPSGNWNVSENPGAVAHEIYNWRDGRYGELVPFIVD